MKKPLTALAITMVITGSLFYCYEFFVQVAPAVMTKALMHDLKINATLLGLMSGCFFYAYTLLQMPAGLLLDRFGARIVLTATTFICALSTLLFSHAHSVMIASLARFLMGASSAFAFVSALYLVIRWIPARHRALFIGFVQTFSSIGAIIGTTTLAIMMNRMGWRQSMFLFFIAGLILTVLLALIIRNKPKNFIEHHAAPNILQTLKIVLHNRQTWVIALYSFMIWAPITGFAALWGISFLKISQPLSVMQAANGISLIWMGIAVGSPFVGWISDRWQRRCLPLTCVALIGLITMTVTLYVPHLSLIFLYVLLFLIGFAAAGQALVFAVIKDNHHTHTSGAANGFNNMVIVSTGALLQPLIGKLLDMNWQGTMQHGVCLYSMTDYHIALFILPLCFFIAFIVSHFFIRETYCQSVD